LVAPFKGDAERLIVMGSPADSKANNEATMAENVNGGELLGQHR
jgi:hypothetical protein